MRNRYASPIVRNQLFDLGIEIKIWKLAGINRREIKRQPVCAAQQVHRGRKP
jgi:hypothetical protein